MSSYTWPNWYPINTCPPPDSLKFMDIWSASRHMAFSVKRARPDDRWQGDEDYLEFWLGDATHWMPRPTAPALPTIESRSMPLMKDAWDALGLGAIVVLGWEDSLGCPQGWEAHSPAVSDINFTHVASAGYVTAKTDEAVQIAAHVATLNGKANCIAGHMVIPRKAIFEVTVLSPPPTEE